MHGKRKDRGQKKFVHHHRDEAFVWNRTYPSKEGRGRERQWRASGRTHVHVYVCTPSMRDRKYMERQRDGNVGEEERGRGRNGPRETRRTAARCSWLCWRGQRESKTREQGNHMYLTWNLYMAANGWERSRAIVEGGRNVRRSYTHAHSIHTYTRARTGHYCQPSLGGHRAPIPSTAIEICRKCAANARVSLENFFDLLYRPRNLSSNSPILSSRAFVIPSHLSNLWKVEFFLWRRREWKEGIVWNRWIEIPSLSDWRYRGPLFQEAFKIHLRSFDARLKKTSARPSS